MLARVPPLLRLGVIGAAVLALVRIASTAIPGVWLLGDWFGLALGALATPVALAICAGTFELASRLTGRGRTAALVAGYAAAIDLVLALGDPFARAAIYEAHDRGRIASEVLGGIWMAAGVDFTQLDALSVGAPLVAVVAVAIAVFALRGIAALASIAELASSRGLAFVVAMLISIALVNVVADSSDALALLAFGGLFSLISLALVASVMSRAAKLLAANQPAIPTATAISAPEA